MAVSSHAALNLYEFPLQGATQITHSVLGNFTGTKQQLIIVARGQVLELLRPDSTTGKITSVLTQNIYGIIRSLLAFRFAGGTKDFICVGSDSGRIVILEYNTEKNVFDKLHQETFGKSGCRRIVPGQFLAADPKGRAIMIGAVEKQKLVYIMNRDAAARLTISSPLEAHKALTLVYDMVGLDVGFENPLFACLEVDYEDIDKDHSGAALGSTAQTLTFYELDLGLNHVVRKQSDELPAFASQLIRVPGGGEGPGGVIVCFEGLLQYRNLGGVQAPVTVRLPVRGGALDDRSRGAIVACHATHKTKQMLFFLLQTEQGDLFRLTMTMHEHICVELKLKYFDTVPVATGLSLLKSGLLFVAAEFGNHFLFQIAHLGENDDEREYSSLSPPDEPRKLLNLLVLDEVDSLSPITACHIADLTNEDSPQFYLACGKGPDSSLRALRHGLEVTEMAVSELPGSPHAVWTVKRHARDAFDAFIIVSFVNATLVLSIGETVEEVSDSGILGTAATLAAAQIGEDALLQVYADGIRHIRVDGRVNEWKAPPKRPITHCAVNSRQVAIALLGGDIVYFETDGSGQLNEYTERMQMPADVTCMTIGRIAEGAQRSRFLAIGCADNTVRVVSLSPADCLQPASMQALPAKAESLAIADMVAREGEVATTYLNIGLENGVLLRSVVDDVSGGLSDTRTRYLGSRAVKLVCLSVQGREAVLALTSRPWLGYTYQGASRLTPLSYEALEHACSFKSEQCAEGVVAISRNTLRILTLNKLGSIFNTVKVALPLTPRKLFCDPVHRMLVVIEGDHRAYPAHVVKPPEDEERMDMSPDAALAVAAGDAADPQAARFLGLGHRKLPPKAGAGHWSANVRFVDPASLSTLGLYALAENEMAVSATLADFGAHGPAAQYLAVGTVKDWVLAPQSFTAAFINIYRIVGAAARQPVLELLHKTEVDHIPAALTAFQGRLLAGVGKYLRLYELGKKKLLRKSENKHVPTLITDIKVFGHRIVVSDLRESIHLCRYKPLENAIVVFCDDTCPRWVTQSCFLDYNTIATVDKFGNFAVSRLPAGASDDVAEDPSGAKAVWDRGVLNGAPQKFETLSNYFLGDTALSLQKVTLTPGGSECLVYTTMAGAIGAIVPFTNREDVDFFQHLEMHIRQEQPPLCGRDHLSFRSYYFPVKHVLDGSFCEEYTAMDPKKKRSVAEELDRTPAEIARKLEDMRNRYAF